MLKDEAVDPAIDAILEAAFTGKIGEVQQGSFCQTLAALLFCPVFPTEPEIRRARILDKYEN
jgi:hypothetical protein